jgi:hypothetical protein
VNQTSAYSYYTLIVTRSGGGGAAFQGFSIGELRYFGTPGPTTLDKGSLTLGRSLDVPRISRYDVDTETPRPEKLVVDFDTTVNSSPTDISGKGNHGAFGGSAQYSPADKAFVFDGTSGCNISGNHNLSGSNPVHTISGWIKKTSTNTDWEYLFTIGTSSTGNMSGFTMNSGNLYFTIFGDGVVFNPPDNFNNNWQHIVGVYTGGTTLTPSNFIVYVNGVKVQTIAGLGNTFTLTGNQVTLGANTGNGERFIGQISNFKLYNVALEPSEVKKLYNLGRTGRSMVISDTAVGIGKVPEAQLDVRGNLKVSGAISSNSPGWSYWRYTSGDMNDVIYNSATDGPVGGFSTLEDFGQNWETGISGLITDRGTSRNFDPTTGTYTAPEKGVYMVNFTWSISGGSGGDDSQYIHFVIAGNPDGGDWETGRAFINRGVTTNAYLMYNPEFITRPGIEQCWSINDIVLLDTGSTIYVRLENVDTNTTLVMEKCNFSGFKIA